MLQTPILFLIFKRLDTSLQVLEQIRIAAPAKLYIAADGPRNEEEKERCEVVRKAVLTAIDWPCEVKTLWREENLGCSRAVTQAITWFFGQEERGIILEDDCLPDPSFFSYCEALLSYYEPDGNIMGIGGNNFQQGRKRGSGSYYFSRYLHIWGWATWRRSWVDVMEEMERWNGEELLEQIKTCLHDREQFDYWKEIFNSLPIRKESVWDYFWMFYIWKQKGMAIVPNKNLVVNIGFGKDATNTKNVHAFLKDPKLESLGQIEHPRERKIDHLADRYTFKHHYHIAPSTLNKWRNFMYAILPKQFLEAWWSLKSNWNGPH